jgi:predicted flap endonuclease-1-like 5' DNA nuclease/predicted  nucleic acid-binding Zn-ribbon protein
MFENINWCQFLPWMLIGAAILGGLIGWFLRKIKMQPMLMALNGDLSKSQKEYSDLNINYGSLQTEKSEADKYNLDLQAQLGDLKAKFEKSEADLKIANQSLVMNGKAIAQLETDLKGKDVLIGEKDAALAVCAGLSTDIEGLKAQLSAKDKSLAASAGLSADIKGLKTELGNLKAQLSERDIALAASAGLSGDIDGLNVELGNLKAQLSEKEVALAASVALAGDLNGCQSKVAKLQQELTLLQAEIDDLRASASTRGVEGGLMMGAGLGSEETDQDAILAEIKANASGIPLEDLGAALENSRDNLLRINTITPWQEAKLNAAGINSYLQLARMQEEEAKLIAGVAQLDADTIQSEDWKGQARALLAGIAAAVSKDNLKKIEGIGPKIEQLCFNNGIYTFKALANTKASVLLHILKEGGSRFRMHNPATWPKQAEMAANGEWDALKVWQDKLDGGKE